ncbi:hypothetical protein [Salinisphaera dokdonensis]|uniref:hypothetical protein n=1 Tax=Salinisphaera dokdonensis TaxID=454598 RepID=UPI0033409201
MSDLLAKRLCSVALSVLAVSFVSGCATNGSPSGDEGQMPLADSEAAFGYEQTEWGKPFWERWMDEARAQGRASVVGQNPTAGAPAQVGGGSAAMPVAMRPDLDGLRPKLGVYIAADQRDSLSAYRLMNTLDRYAAANGLTLVKPNELDESVGGSDACGAATPMGCPELLGIFPGIRALLVLDINSTSGGVAQVRARMVDTDFGIEYDAVSTELALRAKTLGDGSDVTVWSDHVLGTAADRISIAPWFAHSFALNGEDMYINAGRSSGLEADSTLAVHGEGSVVRSPAGRIIAWEPGPEEGRIRIKQFVGQNVAVAEQVSGRMPTPKDRLTLVE